MPAEAIYSLVDLCTLAGVTPRTVRYYVAEGILRAPRGSGPGARYHEGHLARLRLVRRLQREHLPLAEISRRLAALSDEEAVGLASAEPVTPPDSALEYVRAVLQGKGVARSAGAALLRNAPPPATSVSLLRAVMPGPGAGEQPPAHPGVAGLSPGAPSRSQWERIALTSDIEIHVRRPLERAASRTLTRLLEAAREILQEDQP